MLGHQFLRTGKHVEVDEPFKIYVIGELPSFLA